MGRWAILREGPRHALTAHWPPAFAWGHVGSALVIGVTAGSFVDGNAVWIFGGSFAVGAIVSALVCWAWPGFAGAWWKLWLMAVLANPVFLVALTLMWMDRECLIHHTGGWSCMFSDFGPDLAAVCLADAHVA